MTKFANILETIGRTPVVRVAKLAPPGIDLFVKIEAFNPMGSVKDRLALGIIEDAERTGALKPGQTVVEATSGNTGIALAMVCAAKGYKLILTMPESMSLERRKMLKFLGAVTASGASVDLSIETGSAMRNRMPTSGGGPGNPFSGNFRTSDGGTINLCILTPGPHIRDTFEHLGIGEAADDPRFAYARGKQVSDGTIVNHVCSIFRNDAFGPLSRSHALAATRAQEAWSFVSGFGVMTKSST